MTPRRLHLAWMVLGLALCAVLAVVLFAILKAATTTDKISALQNTNARKIDASEQSLALIKSCTTPGMDCYERGQRQSAKAVGDINKVIILAAACASGLPDGVTVAERQDLISTCVIDRLAAG